MHIIVRVTIKYNAYSNKHKWEKERDALGDGKSKDEGEVNLQLNYSAIHEHNLFKIFYERKRLSALASQP